MAWSKGVHNMRVTRKAWLEMMSADIGGYPQSLEIMGYKVDLNSVEELRLALFWVSLQNNELMNYMQSHLGVPQVQGG